MKILLVNDDGYKAPGLCTLADKLSVKHEVIVVAPSKEKSCFSHALSFSGLKDKKVSRPYACFKLNGTPCDCVKYGLLMLARDVDCVISGINNTVNLGSDCIYSGTVNAAQEAAFLGKKAIAVSTEVRNGDFVFSADFILSNLEALLSLCEENVFVSVNIPFADKADIKGVRITSCGVRRYNDRYDKIKKRRGRVLRGEVAYSPNDANSDVVALADGCISVSPLRFAYLSDTEKVKGVKLCL